MAAMLAKESPAGKPFSGVNGRVDGRSGPDYRILSRPRQKLVGMFPSEGRKDWSAEKECEPDVLPPHHSTYQLLSRPRQKLVGAFPFRDSETRRSKGLNGVAGSFKRRPSPLLHVLSSFRNRSFPRLPARSHPAHSGRGGSTQCGAVHGRRLAARAGVLPIGSAHAASRCARGPGHDVYESLLPAGGLQSFAIQ